MRKTVRISLLLMLMLMMGVMVSGLVYALEIVAGPYLQNPTETSMTVMWLTDAKCTSWVEFGTEGGLDQTAVSSRDGLIDADQTIHRIKINNLSPGTAYTYRVCSKEILRFEPYKVTYGQTLTGDSYHFTTLSRDKKSTSFIVLNDIHQRNDILEKLINLSSSEPYDLVFLNGDILSDIEDEAQIVDHVLKPCSDLFAKQIPFIYVRGNHETRGRYARRLADYLATPTGRYYYSFDQGPVHFIVLDGGEDKEDSNPAYGGLADFDRYRDAQAKWLNDEIQSPSFKNATYRVVLVHMPPTPSKEWHGPDDLYNKWRPLLNQGKIDLMISGHTHQYAVVPPEKGICDYPIIIGGAPKEGQATVIRVDATEDKLRVVMKTDDDQIVGTYECTAQEKN